MLEHADAFVKSAPDAMKWRGAPTGVPAVKGGTKKNGPSQKIGICIGNLVYFRSVLDSRAEGFATPSIIKNLQPLF